MHLVAKDAGHEGPEHAQQHCGAHAQGLQDGDQCDAEHGQQGRGFVQVAEGDGGGGAGDDKSGVAQADEGDEQTDSASHSRVQLIRNGREQTLAYAAEGQQKKEDAGQKHGAERRRPGHAHALHHRVGEVSVQAHARCQCERVVGQRAHKDGAERRTQAGRHRDCRDRHTRFAQDRRVDKDDVGHRDEGRQAGKHLGAPRGAVFGEMEVQFQALAHGLGLRDGAGIWV